MGPRRSKIMNTGTAVRFILTTLLFCCAPAFSQTRSEFDSTLVSVKSLFDGGSYISSEIQARRALEEKNLSDSLRVQFEKYVAFSLVAQDKNDAAVEHFENALKVDSTLTLDTELTSPKILAVFDKAKAQYLFDKRKNGFHRKQDSTLPPEGSGDQDGGGTKQGPTFRAMLFPGWEQAYQGKETKGYILLAAGTAAAVSAMASDLLRSNARSNYLSAMTPELASSRYKTYNLYYHAEYYSVSAFVLVYVYSALDSFVDLPPFFNVDYSPKTLAGRVSFLLHF
ncbi:MAG: hypothetical protein WAO19_06945 [Candidatus Kryptoniota bacterium]